MTERLLRLWRDERGITALETAIILIAFVVVASVFAFTILSAGTTSTERGRQAIYEGLENVEGSAQVLGSVTAQTDGSKVLTVTFTLASAGGQPVDLTAYPNNKLVIDYRDPNQYVTNIPWSATWIVTNTNGTANMLEEDEQVKISVPNDGTLSDDLTSDLGTDTEFTLELKPPQGGIIAIERRTPPDLRTVMQLD